MTSSCSAAEGIATAFTSTGILSPSTQTEARMDVIAGSRGGSFKTLTTIITNKENVRKHPTAFKDIMGNITECLIHELGDCSCGTPSTPPASSSSSSSCSSPIGSSSTSTTEEQGARIPFAPGGASTLPREVPRTASGYPRGIACRAGHPESTQGVHLCHQRTHSMVHEYV